MKTLELLKVKGVSLVAVLNEDGNVQEYVTCRDYAKARPYGDQWTWGHYFGKDLKAALKDFEDRA